MGSLAITELAKDWEQHVKAARGGDHRSAHAAHEVWLRLEQIGASQDWLDQAKKQLPSLANIQPMTEAIHGQ